MFDVNETLTDIESLTPMFERIFGERRAMRDWFGQALTYSMAATLSGSYVDFSTLGQGVLRMLGSIHHVNVTEDDERELKESLLTMPAHPDVAGGLEALRSNGL